LLQNVEVKKLIEEAKAKRIERVQIDSDWLLKRLVEELEAYVKDLYDDNNRLLPVKEWPDIWTQGLTVGVDVTTFGESDPGKITKVRVPDKIRRLGLIGKHVDVKAFVEVHRHEASESIIDTMQKVRERAKSLRR
jgi:phage terminase small subunit